MIYKRGGITMKKIIEFKRGIWIATMIFLILTGIFITNHRIAKAAPTNEGSELKLATHNVYMLSTLLYPNWGQGIRAKLIPKAKYLNGMEVLIINEAFDNHASYELLKNLKQQFPYQTPVLGRSRSGWDRTEGSYSNYTLEDGGVTVVSQYPIVEKIQHVYKHGCGFDNYSNKGFVYTKIKKGDKFVHVIGTHTQSEDTSCGTGRDRAIRAEQMQELSHFVKEKNIPADEVVYIGGDMNVNKRVYTGEYEDMLKNLNAREPVYNGYSSTWDPVHNSITHYNYPKGTAEYLDYIFVDKDHRQPGTLVNRAVNEKSPLWKVYAFPYWYTYDDYSDHYPVIAYSW